MTKQTNSTKATKTATKGTAAALAALAPTKAPATPKAPKAPKAPTVATITIKGQPAKAYRTNSARAAYWALVQQYDGQPLTAFVAFAHANPPSTPKHGTLAGKAEPTMGWVQYFVREGVLALTSK